MPRQLKCRICPNWHDTDEPWPHECRGHFRRHDEHRSSLAAPMLLRDQEWSKGMVCNADGKTYHSWSDYKRAVKAAGCEILGSKEQLPPRPPPLRP